MAGMGIWILFSGLVWTPYPPTPAQHLLPSHLLQISVGEPSLVKVKESAISVYLETKSATERLLAISA